MPPHDEPVLPPSRKSPLGRFYIVDYRKIDDIALRFSKTENRISIDSFETAVGLHYMVGSTTPRRPVTTGNGRT